MVGFVAVQSRKKRPEEWMNMLLKSKFFGPCDDHQELSKNEAKVFCIDCNRCICQHCSSSESHMLHKLLQIRRYVYHDVVRFHDIHKHFDCSKIQTYTTNAAKVVFLNPRPQSRPSKINGGAFCEVCERNLSEPNQFCSVACKFLVTAVDKSRDQSSDNTVYGSFRIPEFSALCMNDENQESESNSKKDESSTSITGELESSEDNLILHCWLTNSSCLKPKKQQRHKRKGVPHRSPLS